MTTSRIATALSLLGGLFIIYVGINYLIAPEMTAAGFGLPAVPEGDAMAFLNLKGVRDVVSGLVILGLLATKQRFALGVAMLATSLTPFGDMATVLSWHGSTATAFGVHGFTAVLVALAGVLLIRERRSTTTDHALVAA
ncbi:DUF4267 domain-containing protein [Nocardia sp. NPDC057272]|uniref:DUF4267 domain-containing protein n=1 Tax=Nocardia sp. NPDC057272 TaxID=3346079 RepID=UPI00363A79C8